ncbi:unnamed protein product [Discosporangium mesarthrocarpum]
MALLRWPRSRVKGNLRCQVILLVGLSLVLCLSPALASEDDTKDFRKAGSRQNHRGGVRDGRLRHGRRPVRDYDGVDPTFQVTLDGVMTGGGSQKMAEAVMANHFHARLETLLRGAETEKCRAEITKAFAEYMGAQILERSLPMETDRFFSQCKDYGRPPPHPPPDLH